MAKLIAVVGAGPAGATFAREAASAGCSVTLFDHRAPWEKPCGGMLGSGTIEENTILNEYPHPCVRCSGVDIESPQAERDRLWADRRLELVSRLELGAFLLERAQQAGAVFRQERVLGISKRDSAWSIRTAEGDYRADVVVGADGATSRVRRTLVGRVSKQDLSLCCGYFVNGVPLGDCIMKFLDVDGYLWVFSRATHATAGIIASLTTSSARGLFTRVDQHLAAHYPNASKISKWTALVPTAQSPDFFDQPCCGRDWVLLGDAAGHVDPLLGEGIYFAFRSARLAAEALIAGNLLSYETAWRQAYGDTLKAKAQLRATALELFGGAPELMGAYLFRLFSSGQQHGS